MIVIQWDIRFLAATFAPTNKIKHKCERSFLKRWADLIQQAATVHIIGIEVDTHVEMRFELVPKDL